MDAASELCRAARGQSDVTAGCTLCTDAVGQALGWTHSMRPEGPGYQLQAALQLPYDKVRKVTEQLPHDTVRKATEQLPYDKVRMATELLPYD